MATIEDKKIIIAGGSGFLGISLATHLTSAGAKVTILSRSKLKVTGPWEHCIWDGRTTGPWCDVIDGADGLVNLAGRTVDCIKTPDHKDEIIRSRVESTNVLGRAMRLAANPPPVWVQMSTAHIYGDPPTAVCTEESAFGVGLAPKVAKAWEAAFNGGLLPSQRGVLMRTSFVIGRDLGAGGGALDKLGWLARIGLGGKVGKGTQGMSWIHELDINRFVELGLTDQTTSGVYILSSPNPVSQVDFMRELRRAVGMPIGLPAFEWMVRIGAPIIFKTDPELALYGRYVIPQRLIDEGFEFEYPDLAQGLKNCVSKKARPN